MKSFLKFFVPVVIFLVTLSLVFKFTRKESDKFRGGAEQRWVTEKEGDHKLYPELDDMFQFPGAVSKLQLLHEGKLLSTTTYSVNRFGLRDREAEELKRSHFIIAGCSYVFGHGVEYGDMISTQLKAQLPDVNVRNIGLPAGGLHTTLRYLEIVDPRLWAPEAEGHFVYVAIDDHFARFLHHPSYLVWAPETAPFYTEKDGKISYGGKMEDKASYRIMQFLSDHELGGLLSWFLPDPHSPERISFFVGGVVELKRRYLEKYPKGKFSWVLHPLSGLNHLYADRVRKLSRERGVPLTELHQMMHWLYQEKLTRPEEQFLKHDNHPSPVNNKLFAGWMKWHYFSERTIEGGNRELLLKSGVRLSETPVTEKPAVKDRERREEGKVKK